MIWYLFSLWCVWSYISSLPPLSIRYEQCYSKRWPFAVLHLFPSSGEVGQVERVMWQVWELLTWAVYSSVWVKSGLYHIGGPFPLQQTWKLILGRWMCVNLFSSLVDHKAMHSKISIYHVPVYYVRLVMCHHLELGVCFNSSKHVMNLSVTHLKWIRWWNRSEQLVTWG